MEYTEREIQLVLTMFLRDKNERVIADEVGLSIQDVRTIIKGDFWR